MLEVWETRSSSKKSVTGLEQKNIQYILFKKCTVQKTIRMIGRPNGDTKLCPAVAPVKRQVLLYFYINNKNNNLADFKCRLRDMLDRSQP